MNCAMGGVPPKQPSMEMDERTRQNIEDIEKLSGRPTGIGRISRGECPVHGISPIVCTFCGFGHQLDCHYPQTCEEAKCSHWQQQAQLEDES